MLYRYVLVVSLESSWTHFALEYGTQIALKSWWPLLSTWDDCGRNLGYWTEWNEVWFQKHLRGILDGTTQPLAASKWRDRLTGFKDACHLKANVEKFSLEFLESI